MIFLLDTNCFVRSSRYLYPLDIAVSFWNMLEKLANQRMIYSIDKVKKEIYLNDDDLKKWCETHLPDDFFLLTETEYVYEKFGDLVKWASSGNYTQNAIDQFIGADKADIYLASYAAVNPKKFVVVTEEISRPNSKKSIKLPDACSAVNVHSINFIDMLRQLNVTF